MVNVRGVGESHEIVKQTYSAWGQMLEKAQGDPGVLKPCLTVLFHMTFAMGGISRAGSRQEPFLIL